MFPGLVPNPEPEPRRVIGLLAEAPLRDLLVTPPALTLEPNARLVDMNEPTDVPLDGLYDPFPLIARARLPAERFTPFLRDTASAIAVGPQPCWLMPR